MTDSACDIFIIGYGNPGRQDDGLGPAFVERLANKLPQAILSKVRLQENYQLNVEDALEVSTARTAIFVDASINAKAPFDFRILEAENSPCLGSHSLTPAQVMQLCSTLFKVQPSAYVLAIRGYRFDQFEEALSEQAQANLNISLDFLATWLAKVAAGEHTRADRYA